MSLLRRLGLVAIGLPVLLLASMTLLLSLAYSPGYLFRWAVWQDADVGDHARFPARSLAAAVVPFTFGSPSDPQAAADAVRDALVASGAIGGDADAFLEQTGTQAFIVIQDDVILYEGYFGDFERDLVATSFSVAKSYVSALIGIAIEEGHIASVDDPVTDYLPELMNRDERFTGITIAHLLDMTSGIRYDDSGLPTGDDALTYYFDDLRALALERSEIEEPPGQRWHYVNYNPLLLGMILERATDMAVTDYLAENIWTRIGTEFPATWSLDSDDGFEKMESGINARAIDFAKFGRLYLAGGMWDGEQVVPRNWVESSVQVDGSQPDGYPAAFEQSYGTVSHERYWWRIDRPGRDDAYSALGNHGQITFVSPADRLIVVRLGERYGIPSFEWFEVFTSLADQLAP